MFSKNIKFINYGINKKKSNKIFKLFKNLLLENNEILRSLSLSYKDSFSKSIILKFKKKKQIILIGMGGSILGARAIYNFLKPKFKKFYFIDNLKSSFSKKIRDKNNLNIVISKSGNTLETISNSNILINQKKSNIFITENKNSILMNLGKKLKADIVHHNNFIGGRYSVLSEVGMLPARLMGYSPNKFRVFNNLIKSKKFVENLILNVTNTLMLIEKKKYNSIILNYDERSSDIFYWYQQLIAESLGKNNKGILPVISSMPKDNHSLMQFYLDGVHNNFFTFFFVKEKNSIKIDNSKLDTSNSFLKNKSLNDITFTQFKATANIFKKKSIPFRSFVINKRDENTIGELFAFFILETILLARAIKINPFNQPAVELIKTETSNIFSKY